MAAGAAMAQSGISETRVGAVATLMLENPPYNPIGVAQVASLKEAMQRLGEAREVGAIVITGAGNQHFSVGANLKEAEPGAEVGPLEFCAERQALLQQIEDTPEAGDCGDTRLLPGWWAGTGPGLPFSPG